MKTYKEIKSMVDKIGEVYENATKIAMANNQTVGEKRDYYITLYQLEMFMKILISEAEI